MHFVLAVAGGAVLAAAHGKGPILLILVAVVVVVGVVGVGCAADQEARVLF